MRSAFLFTLVFSLLAATDGFAMGKRLHKDEVDIDGLHELFSKYAESHEKVGGECQISGTRIAEGGNVLAFQLEKNGKYFNLQFKKSDPTQTVQHEVNDQGVVRTYIETIVDSQGCDTSRNCPPAGHYQDRQIIVYHPDQGKIFQFAENQTRISGNSPRAETTSVQCGAFQSPLQ